MYDENDEDDMEYDRDGCIFCDECDEYDEHGFLLDDDYVDNKDLHGFSASKSDDYGCHSVSFYSTEQVNHDNIDGFTSYFWIINFLLYYVHFKDP